MSRQKLILAVLLAMLGGALWYSFWASPQQERTPAVARSSAKAKRPLGEKPELTLTDKRRVRLEILDRGVDAFSEPQRDIFRLTQPRPAAVAPISKPVVSVPTAPPVFTPVPVERLAPIPSPAVRFTVLGFLEKENIKTVFLSLGNEIFIVKEGDRFGKDKEFEAEEITDEKLVVRQGDGNFPITVLLTDKTPSLPSSAPPPVGRFPTRVRPTGFRPPPIQIEYDEEDEDEDDDDDEDFEEEDLEEDEDLDEDLDEELEDSDNEEETPDEEIESGNPAAGSIESLQLRRMIQ